MVIFRRTFTFLFELRLHNAAITHRLEAVLPEKYEFRFVSQNELLGNPEFNALERQEFARRFNAGDQCYATFSRGRLVNTAWLHLGSVYVRGAGLLLELGPLDGYVYSVTTWPTHRGLGIYRAAQGRLIEAALTIGVSRLFSLVDHKNAVPLRVLPRFGYERTYAVNSVTACGIKRTVIQNLETMAESTRVHYRTPSQIFRI